MIRLLYTPLATVQFTHSFYKNGLTSDFVLTPTEATRALLQTYDWAAKQLGSTFTLLGREDEPGLPTSPLNETVRLTFLVQCTNPLLPGVSDWGGANGPFFFTNLNTDGTTKTSLTVGPVLSATDRLPAVSGQQLSLSLEKGIYKSVVISQVQPGDGLKPVQTIPVKPDQETLDIRLTKPGRYMLAKQPANESAPMVSELYLDDKLAFGPPFFGLVELVLSQTPAAPVAYTVAIQHRKKIWRYVLVDVQAKHILDADADGNPSFKLIYQPPADAVFPTALSSETLFDTQKSLEAREQILVQRSTDPASTPAQRQADLETLRLVRSDLGMMQTMLSDGRVKAVFLAQLPDALPIVKYVSPVIKLQRTGGTDLLPVPTAETPNATIFYTI